MAFPFPVPHLPYCREMRTGLSLFAILVGMVVTAGVVCCVDLPALRVHSAWASAAACSVCRIALVPEPLGDCPEFGIRELNGRHQSKSCNGLLIDAFLFVGLFEIGYHKGDSLFFHLESLMVPVGQRDNRRCRFGRRIDGVAYTAIAFENDRSVRNTGKRYRCH